MRKPLIIANWKMNKNIAEAREFCHSFLPVVKDYSGVEIVICPPFTCLDTVRSEIYASNVKLGAQNLFWEDKGAYTGEISASMLTDAGCDYVIIGHSERRQILGEEDVIINRKLLAAREAGLVPVLCVGETLQERQHNQAMEVVKEQLTADLKNVMLKGSEIVIAYEPVWAIGTGVNASPRDAQEMICFIRRILAKLYDQTTAEAVRILYGGSVKAENAAEIFAEEDVDGALVGGASLKADSFAEIVRLGANG